MLKITGDRCRPRPELNGQEALPEHRRRRARIWRWPNRSRLWVSSHLLLGLTLLVACANGDGTWRRIQADGVLTIGLDPSYPPFELDEAGVLSGLDVDLGKAIAEDLGLMPEYVYFGYDGLYDALGTGQVDVLISALIVAPERTRDFAYSSSYFKAGQVLIVPVNSGIEATDDLEDHTLAVELGADGHVLATNMQRQLTGLKIVPYNSAEEALSAVVAGIAEAALVDIVGGRLYVLQEPALRATEEVLASEPFAIVVRKDDRQLLDNLNESLMDLEASGRLDSIIRKWLG